MKTNKPFSKSLLLILTLMTGLILVSCQKDNYTANFPDPDTLPNGFIGTWVEVNTLKDTISFTTNNESGIFFLQRGFEIRNGYRLPVIGSTGYEYRISSDSITLSDILSNQYSIKGYPFHFDESNLVITVGKFSKYIDTKNSTLIFRKIK
jgi:hypothetical protein